MDITQRIVCRGVCGATTAEADTTEAISSAMKGLLVGIMSANGIREEDIAAVTFTSTPDLHAVSPCHVVRHMGVAWEYVPLMGVMEPSHTGGMERVIRVLLLWNTDTAPREIKHLYLRGTERLRTAGVAEVAC